MDDRISPCVCYPPTPWVSKTQNEIHISEKNSNRQHTPPAGAHMQNISSPSTGVVRPHTARTWEQHMHLYITLVPSENRTQLAQEDGQFSLLPAHAQHPCSCARIRVCVCAISTSACVCVCVACRSASTLFTYPGYQAKSVVSNTSGTSQHRRINDARAIDALNCEAPSCLCDYSPAGRSNRTQSSQQESS